MAIKKKDIKDVKEAKQSVELSDADKIKKARAERMARSGVTVKMVEENTREEFRKYFVQIKKKLGLGKEMENVIWLHFKAAGFDKKDKFDEGVKHFGYKL